MSGLRLPPLYPIVNVAGADHAECERAFGLAVELADAGCSLIQLRAKTLGAGAMTALARRMVEALRGYQSELIVNDRADVAAASGAAGVHVGDEDLSVEAVRRVVGADAIVGFSTHSVEEAARAATCGADYLGFGPVFDSPTKAGVRDPRGLELLAQACRATPLPVVAIGGVELGTAPQCWSAGAASVAVISEIERSTDRRGLVAAYWQHSVSTAEHPDVGFYYVRPADLPAIQSGGLPVGAVVHLQPLTKAEARVKYGYPADAEVLRIDVDLRGLRAAGYPMPPIVPSSLKWC